MTSRLKELRVAYRGEREAAALLVAPSTRLRPRGDERERGVNGHNCEGKSARSLSSPRGRSQVGRAASRAAASLEEVHVEVLMGLQE